MTTPAAPRPHAGGAPADGAGIPVAPAPPAAALWAVFPGASEMAARCRAFDWAATPLGPADRWPVSLRTTVATLLTAQHPMLLFWGPEYVQLYNDAYIPTLGGPDRHPGALGQPAADWWGGDVWAFVGPALHAVMATGEATGADDQMVPLPRHGRTEDTYWTYCYSPAYDDAGRVGGVLLITQETTARVRAEGVLRMSEERLRLAVAATDLGIFDWDLTTDRVTVNARFREILGLAPGDAVMGAAMLGGVVHPDDRALVEATLAGAFDPRGSGHYQLEHRAVTPHGEIWLLTFGQVHFAGEGAGRRAVRVIGNDLDVTARKGAEAERERLLAESEAANAALTAANAHLQDQQLELELANQQLQEQAAELEAQAEELHATAAHLEEQTEAADRARVAAEAERARTAGILEATADGYFALDAAFRFVAVNAATERLLAHSRDQLVGRVIWDVFPGTVGTVFERSYRRVATERVPVHFAGEYDENGLALVPEVDAYPAPDGGPPDGGLQGGVVVFWRDIRPRLQAEAERERLLAAAEAARNAAEAARVAADLERRRLDAVLEALPVGVIVAEAPSGRLVYSNAAVERVWGQRRATARTDEYSAEWTGYHVDAEGRATDRTYASHEWPLARAVAAGEVVTNEAVDVARPDGTGGVRRVRVSLSAAPIRDGDGAIVGGVVVTADVTEAARARDALAAARDAAAAANQAKAQFLANMSHELRTPLNAISGYVQLLDMGLHGPVTEDQRTALGRVQRAQARLLALINDILNYAKLESGRVEYDLRPVDVRDVVADVAPLVEPQLVAKGLAFALLLPDAPCVVWADREKLGQVLLNLLSNAGKFTEARHPATGARGRVMVHVAERGGHTDTVFLRVTDTGRGIPRAKQDAVFEPFVQVQTGYAHATEGTGLGLAISRDLARGMGGDLRVRSVEGEGSTFTVALRRAVTADGAVTDRRSLDERREDERRAAEDRRGTDTPGSERDASGHATHPPATTADPSPMDV